MFGNYKTVVLIKYMRAVLKNPQIALKKEKEKEVSPRTEIDFKNFKTKIALFANFVKHFELTRCLNKLQRVEQGHPDLHQLPGLIRRNQTNTDNDSDVSDDINDESNAGHQSKNRKNDVAYMKELNDAKNKAIEIDKWIDKKQKIRDLEAKD